MAQAGSITATASVYINILRCRCQLISLNLGTRDLDPDPYLKSCLGPSPDWIRTGSVFGIRIKANADPRYDFIPFLG